MPKQFRDVAIQKKTTRAKLPARQEPYWKWISEGLYVGYTKLPSGAETWRARYRESGAEKPVFTRLGRVTEHNDYAAAEAACKAWGGTVIAGAHVAHAGASVLEVCNRYADRSRETKLPIWSRDMRKRFLHAVARDPLGAKRIDKLQAADLTAWRQRFSKGRKAATFNRTLAVVRAAITDHFHGTLPAAFKKPLQALPTESGRGETRRTYLTREQRDAILENVPSPEFGYLVLALTLTGARPIELKQLRVSDVDIAQGRMTLLTRKGKTSRTRVFPLRDPNLLKLMTTLTAGRPGDAHVFLMPNGRRWNDDATFFLRNFNTAAKAAGVDATAYALRHSWITDAVKAGGNAVTIAALAGTSTSVIDKHYFRMTTTAVNFLDVMSEQ